MKPLPTREKATRSCDHTQPFRFAEWDYFFGRKWRLESGDLFNYGNYSRSAQFVQNKWTYIFRNIRGTLTCHRELWIDEKGNIYGTAPSLTVKSISERGNSQDKDSLGRYYTLDFFDHRGVRIDAYYVLYSTYRLPMVAILELEKATVPLPGHDAAALAIPSLLRSCLRWTRRGSSTRGIYKHEHCEENADVRPIEKFEVLDKEPCVVGFDLLRIALKLSNVYRKKLHAFQRRFVRPEKDDRKEFYRESLARSVHSLVSDSPELADRIKEHLRWKDLEDYLEECRDERRKMIRDYERAAARVCQVLDNPIYEILRSAYRFDEDHPEQEHVAKAAFFTRYYALTLLELNASAAGAVYIARQVDEFLKGKNDRTKAWGGPGDHYLKTYGFPDKPTSTQVFKTTRLVSKSIIAIFTHFVGALIAKRRDVTAEALSKHIKHLFRGGKGFKIGDVVYKDILGVEVAHVEVSAEIWTRGHKGAFKQVRAEVPLLGSDPEAIQALAKYEQQAKDADILLKKTRMAAILFDVVNVGLALNALKEKLGNNIASDWGREALDVSAHTLNLTKTIIEKTYGKALSRTAMRSLSRVSIVTGGYFICADLYDADKASDIHDYDRAYANIGAAVGEAIAIVGILIVLKATATGATAGPAGGIIGFLGGIIAAASYIYAAWATDAPIETMLKHCEWGEYAFQQPDDYLIYEWHYPYTFAQWEKNPEYQLKALTNLVGQFSVERYKADIEMGILKASNAPAIVRFSQLYDDTRLVMRVSGTLEHPNGNQRTSQGLEETIESNRLLKLVRATRSMEKRRPFVELTYPDSTKKWIRKAYEEGYRVKDLSMRVKIELRKGQWVGAASTTLYSDGEIADFNRGFSSMGSHNPHV